MTDRERARGREPIAIVGMACLFPEAGSLLEFWDNIYTARDCITDLPASRWDVDAYYDPDPRAPDKTYCKRGGFIPDTEFDPMEFGLPPNILEVTDNAQLLSLVVAKRALEDAGYSPEGNREFDRERTGVILGVGGGQKLVQPLTARLQYPVWEKVLRRSGLEDDDIKRIVAVMKKAYVPWEENSFPGLLGNVIAGRIANRFDLGGLNCVVDAACASSLAALEMATGELADHRADMMISGGVDADNSIFMYMCFSKTPAFTQQEHLQPFDAASDGMMIGEGIGMIVLKRLSDAERDGDRIYALIKGMGSSSDGRYKSIYAPRSEGQVRALQRAHAAAGVVPQSIELIEAHGTGTVAGDLVEVTTLRQVFTPDGPGAPHVALGSVKSQIGHTKAAAGAAGVIKVALALHHKVLPPTINVTRPHPALNLAGSPLYLNTRTRPWIPSADGGPRRAGVSSFGFGGSNFHAVLEEYEGESPGGYRMHRVARPILLAAPDPQRLQARCREVIADLQGNPETFHGLAEESATSVTRPDWARIGLVATSADEAIAKLRPATEFLHARKAEEAWESPAGLFFRARGLDLTGRVAVLFPGQGSQHLEMGRELAINFPEVRQDFAAMDAIFRQDGKAPLSAVVYPPPSFDAASRQAQADCLQATAQAQPAIGVLSASLFTLLQKSGVTPDFAAGHSFGELTALWVAGAMDRQSFFALARARGRAMAPLPDPAFDPGAMLAVRGDAAAVQRVTGGLPDVSVANLNAPDQIVLAGPRPAVERARQVLQARGLAVTSLPVAAAFHTPLVAHAQVPFAAALATVPFNRPRIPVYANSTGTRYPVEAEAMRDLLAAQLTQPVRFAEQVENLYASGAYLFIECGPGTILTHLVGSVLGDRPHLAIPLNGGPRKDSDTSWREALVRLRVVGLPVRLADPYQRKPMPARPPRRPTTILLSGSNYVSEKTRQAFDEALRDGHRVATPPPADQSLNGEPAPQPAAVPPHFPSSAQAPLPDRPTSQGADSDPAASRSALELFSRQQSESVRAHQQYLNNETEYIKSFQQIMLQQQTLLLAPERSALPAGVLENLSHSLALFHQHQGETTRVHRQYLEYQAGVTQALFALLRDQPVLATEPLSGTAFAPTPAYEPSTSLRTVVPAPVPPPAPRPEPEPAVSTVVADPTPARTAPPWASPPPAPPAEHRPRVESPSPPIPRDQEEAPVKPASRQRLDRAEVSAGLLRIVSEKTGYPVEMLELEMDVEADLGIDSIKRVEILGATQERFPDAPALKPQELAELRTLAEIVDYVVAQEAPSRAPPASSPATIAPLPSSATLWSPVRREPLPPPDRLDISLPPGFSCLISDDGTAVTPLLTEALHSRGWPVTVLTTTPAGHPLPAGVARRELPHPDDSQIRDLLGAITAGQGAPGVFIHVTAPHTDPHSAPAGRALAEEEMVRRVFLLAKSLQTSLTEAAHAGFGAFLTVTRLDGALGTTGIGHQGPIAGGLAGLVKTLSLEWPGVFCRAIDLAPDLPDDQAAAHILAELHDPHRLLSEVGYGPHGRVTLTALEVAGAPDR